MRRLIISAVSLISLIFLGGGTACLAQEMPHGTYRQTCQDINFNGTRLSARCQKVDGGWRNSSIDYRNCRGGEVINDNGNLRCGQGGYGYRGGHMAGWQGGLPPGDYKRTCQNMRVSGNKLSATCQKTDGSWHDTSLNNFNQCRNDIANVDGNLRCPK